MTSTTTALAVLCVLLVALSAQTNTTEGWLMAAFWTYVLVKTTARERS